MVKRIGMRRLAAFAAAAALVLGLVGCGGAQSTAQGNTEPVNLSVWTYYNGDQLESFNKLVDTFNNTVGKEKNITVESYSQGSVNDLETQVMAAAQGKVGASAMPNIFMAYADTAYAMDQMGELADLAPYFTDEERAAYVDSYLTEGDFDDSGSILAYIGSNSSATYFPTQVMLSDTESHDIDLKVLPTPHFEGCEKVSVQQGAGMAVAKTTDAEVEASVVFLKWFTQPENNIAFAVGSGYLPVTHAANDMDAIHSSGLALTGNMENVLTEAVEAVNTNEMYTTKAFEGGTDARSKLGYSMIDLAAADRATVEERLAAGESAEEAEAEFLTDEYFEAWYQSLCDALSQYEG